MSSHVADLIATHGYWIISVAVALESMGIPIPGETVLVTAAIYAGTTHRLNVALVIAAAAVGAVVGDDFGFLIGRRFGFPLLLRYGHLAGIDSRRIKLGQFLFARHGGKAVFFGRFIALLRALAALLAGINCMDWWRFLLFNASGGIVWATVYGLAAYSWVNKSYGCVVRWSSSTSSSRAPLWRRACGGAPIRGHAACRGGAVAVWPAFQMTTSLRAIETCSAEPTLRSSPAGWSLCHDWNFFAEDLSVLPVALRALTWYVYPVFTVS